jgi:hypothetical protein
MTARPHHAPIRAAAPINPAPVRRCFAWSSGGRGIRTHGNVRTLQRFSRPATSVAVRRGRSLLTEFAHVRTGAVTAPGRGYPLLVSRHPPPSRPHPGGSAGRPLREFRATLPQIPRDERPERSRALAAGRLIERPPVLRRDADVLDRHLPGSWSWHAVSLLLCPRLCPRNHIHPFAEPLELCTQKR